MTRRRKGSVAAFQAQVLREKRFDWPDGMLPLEMRGEGGETTGAAVDNCPGTRSPAKGPARAGTGGSHA